MNAMRSCFVLVLSIFLFGSCENAAKQQSFSQNGQNQNQSGFNELIGNPAKLTPGEHFYSIMQNDIETGAMRVSIFEEPDSWLFEEFSTLDQAGIREVIRTRVDTIALRPIANEVQGIIDGNQLDVNVVWNGTQVAGYSDFPRPQGRPFGYLKVQESIPAGTSERTAVFYILPTLELKEGMHQRFHWYNTLYAQLEIVDLYVSGSEQITVPGGTFDTWRVELNGIEFPQVVHISKTPPFLVVRNETVGLPWRFELL